jgi:hypothetical protein
LRAAVERRRAASEERRPHSLAVSVAGPRPVIRVSRRSRCGEAWMLVPAPLAFQRMDGGIDERFDDMK